MAHPTQGRGGEPEIASIELMRQAGAGDGQAANRLLARYGPVLHRWARGRTPRWARNLLDTDDMVEATIKVTMQRLGELGPRHDGALEADLRQALHDRVRDEVRRAATASLNSGPSDPDPSPLERAIGWEAIERYEAALERLDATDRELIVGRIEMGQTYPRLAEILGMPSADAARLAVNRSLLRLAREMADEG